MKRSVFAATAMLVIAAMGVYAFAAYKKPLPAIVSNVARNVNPTAEAAAANPNLAWPGHGQAAIGAAGYGVLASHGAQKSSPTASVAKTMVALTVLKQYPLAVNEQGPTITITAADVNSYNAFVSEDGSVAKVSLGEKITEYQALEALLLPSADNMADTLARWAYGSTDAYAAAADTLAVSLGMANTHFDPADASGFSPKTVSTAHDLVLLGEAALKNPALAQIVAQPTATIPVAGKIQNVNWLLGQNGINGIKTGNTDQAGGVFLFSAKQTFANGQSVTVVGAVMDTSATLVQALNESVPLLKSTQANFALTTLVQAGQSMGIYNVPWSGTVSAVAAKSLAAVTWRGQTVMPKISLKNLDAPIARGAQVGTASFGELGTTPVVTSQPITAPTWRWRLLHVFY